MAFLDFWATASRLPNFKMDCESSDTIEVSKENHQTSKISEDSQLVEGKKESLAEDIEILHAITIPPTPWNYLSELVNGDTSNSDQYIRQGDVNQDCDDDSNSSTFSGIIEEIDEVPVTSKKRKDSVTTTDSKLTRVKAEGEKRQRFNRADSFKTDDLSVASGNQSRSSQRSAAAKAKKVVEVNMKEQQTSANKKREEKHPLANDKDGPDADSEEEDEFEVETILAHRGNPLKTSTLKFKVRWKNFGPTYDTWEPYESCAELAAMDRYLKAHPELKL